MYNTIYACRKWNKNNNLNVYYCIFVLRSVVECSPLSSPVNGAVQMDGPMYSSMASYSCDQGFGLQGDATRMCQADGTWSGATPQCRSELIYHFNSLCAVEGDV